MRRLAALGVAAVITSGCTTYGSTSGSGNSIIAAGYQASDTLIEIARPELDPDRPIIVATVVDIDQLERSSTLGRYISESVSARFTQHRYRMVEMKFQNAVYMKRDEGEMMLTREIRDIASAHRAQAVIVGTYSRGNSTVLINLKVVQPETNIVLAAFDYALRMNRDVCALVNRNARDCPYDW